MHLHHSESAAWCSASRLLPLALWYGIGVGGIRVATQTTCGCGVRTYEQRREATYSASIVSQPKKRSMPRLALAPARPSSLVSSRPVPRPDRSEKPRTNRIVFGLPPVVASTNSSWVLDPSSPAWKTCGTALNGWDGRLPAPTPVRDAVAAGWYVCQGPAAGRAPGEGTATARLSAVDSDAGPRGGGRRAV